MIGDQAKANAIDFSEWFHHIGGTNIGPVKSLANNKHQQTNCGHFDAVNLPKLQDCQQLIQEGHGVGCCESVQHG